MNEENKDIGFTFKTAIPEIDKWIELGYTLEQSEQLAKDSAINNSDVGITAEESYKVLKAAMNKFKYDESTAPNIIEKLSEIDEQQIMFYKNIKTIHVYCTNCKHFRLDDEDIPYCARPNNKRCNGYDMEDSMPFSERPQYEAR